MPSSLLDAAFGEFHKWMQAAGLPHYRERQVWEWVFLHRAESFAAMSSLPKGLRSKLEEAWQIFGMRVVESIPANDGSRKFLFECSDGRRIESVLMFERIRRTLCVSTQVGCGMGCVFCASGLAGLVRNLSAGEILEQMVRARNSLHKDERLSHLVVMGMGESLANLDALIAALDLACSPAGLGISQRRVTISTVGLPEKMLKLAELDRAYNLAVSLHAPTPELRDELVPVNRKVGLNEVIEASDAYFRKTGRRVTFEYVLLGGLNDQPEHARALASLLKGRSAHVNVIPYNAVPGLEFRAPTAQAVDEFVEIASARGAPVTVRRTKGLDIDAACGQLRRRWEDAAKPAGVSG